MFVIVHVTMTAAVDAFAVHTASDWFHATQAMAIIGLVGLGIALLLIILYMCVHGVSKNSTIIGLVATCFLTGTTTAQISQVLRPISI